MTINLFVIANVKQLRTDGSFRILLPFFRTSWGVGVLNSAIFNSFNNRVEFGTILDSLRNLGGGDEPPRYAYVFRNPAVAAKCKFLNLQVIHPVGSQQHNPSLVHQIQLYVFKSTEISFTSRNM